MDRMPLSMMDRLFLFLLLLYIGIIIIGVDKAD